MNLDRTIESQFPFGCFCWHRVSEEKLMVVGHSHYMDGTVLIICATGHNDKSYMPETLTTDNPTMTPLQAIL